MMKLIKSLFGVKEKKAVVKRSRPRQIKKKDPEQATSTGRKKRVVITDEMIATAKYLNKKKIKNVQIADLLDVSESSVSRILNDTRTIKRATEQEHDS